MEHRATCVALRGSVWRGPSLCDLQARMTQPLDSTLPEQPKVWLQAPNPTIRLQWRDIRSSEGRRVFGP